MKTIYLVRFEEQGTVYNDRAFEHEEDALNYVNKYNEEGLDFYYYSLIELF